MKKEKAVKPGEEKHKPGCAVREYKVDHARKLIACVSCGTPMGGLKEARQAYEAQTGAAAAMRRVSKRLGLDVIR